MTMVPRRSCLVMDHILPDSLIAYKNTKNHHRAAKNTHFTSFFSKKQVENVKNDYFCSLK